MPAGLRADGSLQACNAPGTCLARRYSRDYLLLFLRLRVVVLRFARLRVDLRFVPLDDFFGTLPPARRASERPIAMACLRLFTFLPERPDSSVPFFRSFIVFATLDDAFLPYLRAMHSSTSIPKRLRKPGKTL